MITAAKRTKIINRSRIIREVWRSKETSRVNIASALGLNKSTISGNVNELIELGFLQEVSEGASGPQGGKKPINIRLNNSYGYILGMELSVDLCRATIIDLEGTIQYSHTEPVCLGRDNFRKECLRLLRLLQKRVEKSFPRILAIGIAIPGIVDPRKNLILYSIPLGFSETFRFCDEIASVFSVPIIIDNDANACAWGELGSCRLREPGDFIFILLELHQRNRVQSQEQISIGIGLGINGRVHYGQDFCAGEYRSIYLSSKAAGQSSLSNEEEVALESNKGLQQKFFRELAAHIGLLVNTLDLKNIVLGGACEKYGSDVIAVFEQEIANRCSYQGFEKQIRQSRQVRFSSFAENSAAYGAASMVQQRLFCDLETVECPSEIQNIHAAFGVL